MEITIDTCFSFNADNDDEKLEKEITIKFLCNEKIDFENIKNFYSRKFYEGVWLINHLKMHHK